MKGSLSLIACLALAGCASTGSAPPVPVMSLSEAVRAHDADATRRALESGADPNVKDRYGVYPLHLAVAGGLSSVATELLVGGAFIEVRDAAGLTPLLRVLRKPGGLKLLQLLLVRGAHPNATDPNGQTALHAAVEVGDADAIRALVRHGASVDGTNAVGETPLHTAVGVGASTPGGLGAEQLIDVLVEVGASVHKADGKGWTPLHTAAALSQPKSVAALLRAGARTLTSDIKGRTPLHVAIAHDAVVVAQRLLLEGASMDVADASGVTPGRLARRSGKQLVTQLATQAAVQVQAFPNATGGVDVRIQNTYQLDIANVSAEVSFTHFTPTVIHTPIVVERTSDGAVIPPFTLRAGRTVEVSFSGTSSSHQSTRVAVDRRYPGLDQPVRANVGLAHR